MTVHDETQPLEERLWRELHKVEHRILYIIHLDFDLINEAKLITRKLAEPDTEFLRYIKILIFRVLVRIIHNKLKYNYYVFRPTN